MQDTCPDCPPHVQPRLSHPSFICPYRQGFGPPRGQRLDREDIVDPKDAKDTHVNSERMDLDSNIKDNTIDMDTINNRLAKLAGYNTISAITCHLAIECHSYKTDAKDSLTDKKIFIPE